MLVFELFVLAYAYGNVTNKNSYRKYFLQRLKIKNYNIEIDGRNFYNQPINDLIKQYNEVRKISTGQGDDYTTSCSLDFVYFKNNYRLIAADLKLYMQIQKQFNKLFLLEKQGLLRS